MSGVGRSRTHCALPRLGVGAELVALDVDVDVIRLDSGKLAPHHEAESGSGRAAIKHHRG